jgi:predicted HicB family RNase H-like nuclease
MMDALEYLEYKDFVGSVRYSAVDDVFFGRLEGIDDLVVFKGDNVKELNSAFKQAVED